MAQQPERSSIELRANANWHLRRAGIGMVGGFAVLAAGALGKNLVEDMHFGLSDILEESIEQTPIMLAVLWNARLAKRGSAHIRAAIADRKAATALDKQPASVLDLPPTSHLEAADVPVPITPDIPAFNTALPDDQLGVSEVIIPGALIKSLDQQGQQ